MFLAPKLAKWKCLRPGVWRLQFKCKKGYFHFWIERGCEGHWWYWVIYDMHGRYSKKEILGRATSFKWAKEDQEEAYNRLVSP